MRRSIRVEHITCHKVHLPPQISLSCYSIPRQLLGKCQHHTRFFSAGPFQEVCTVDCPLPPYPKYCLHIFPHQITFDLFASTKLLLSPNIITLLFWRTSQIFYHYYTICSNTTIITQNAQILLFSHNMLKYYYFHCTARQIHQDRRGHARRRTWWATMCQGTRLWGVESYIQLAQVMKFRVLHV